MSMYNDRRYHFYRDIKIDYRDYYTYDDDDLISHLLVRGLSPGLTQQALQQPDRSVLGQRLVPVPALGRLDA